MLTAEHEDERIVCVPQVRRIDSTQLRRERHCPVAALGVQRPRGRGAKTAAITAHLLHQDAVSVAGKVEAVRGCLVGLRPI